MSTTLEPKRYFFPFVKRYIVPLWYTYVLGALTLGISIVITLQVPKLSKKIINLINEQTTDMSSVKGLAVTIMFLGIGQIIFRALSRITLFWPGRQLETQIKNNLFDRLLTLPQKFFIQVGFGDLNSRIANDTQHLRVFFAFGVLQILNLIYLLFFTVSQMYVIHPSLTLVCLIPIVTLVLITRLFMPLLHQYSKRTNEIIGTLTNGVTEAFANIHTIHANGASDNFSKRLSVINHDVFAHNIKLLKVRIGIFPLISSFASLSQIIILLYGGHEVITKKLSIGDILAFNFYIGLLSFPLSAFGIILAVYQRAKVAFERQDLIEEATCENDENMSLPINESLPPLGMSILNLNFAYPSFPAGKLALKNINLDLMPGKKLGLFGAIGSGKSTLLNLMARIFNPPSGTVYLNRQDIMNIPPVELRKKILYLPQKVHLFSDTIKNNLCFGLDTPPTMEKLTQACQQAFILEEILGFEKKWESEIGEQGIKLSGGQKQRLALARMFLRQPEIVILDDVLSAVDHQTEQNILHSIYELGCTLIIVSNRPSALRACDEILVLDEGEIIKRGQFSDLEEFFNIFSQGLPIRGLQ